MSMGTCKYEQVVHLWPSLTEEQVQVVLALSPYNATGKFNPYKSKTLSILNADVNETIHINMVDGNWTELDMNG